MLESARKITRAAMVMAVLGICTVAVFGQSTIASIGGGSAEVAMPVSGVNFFAMPAAANGSDSAGSFAAWSNTDFQASTLQGSLLGTPGLWNAQFGETLGKGQFSGSVYVQRFSRNPGALVFTDYQLGVAYGLTDHLELSLSATPYRRIGLNAPGELLGPAQISGGTLPPGQSNFNPIAPFVHLPITGGWDSYTVGLTIGLKNQDRGDRLGAAFQIFTQQAFNQTFADGAVLHPVNNTEGTYGGVVLVDKYVGQADLVFNAGLEAIATADAGGKTYIANRDQAIWSVGVIFPRQARISVIGELNGNGPIDDGTFYAGFGSNSPIDATFGARVNLVDWLGINAGYRVATNQSNLNRSGFVVGLSMGPEAVKPVPPPPPPPPAPSLTCSASAASVPPGTGVRITSSVTPAGQAYTYSWTATGGRVTPSESTATWDTTGVAPGLYTISGRVDNGKGGTSDCSTRVEVREPPHNPPSASATLVPAEVLAGATVTGTATASSPDGRPLTYLWQSSAGRLDTPNQAMTHIDTTGVPPGRVTVNLTVSDDRNLTARWSGAFTVLPPPPPPQPSLGSTLQFKANSSRVDNAAKAALDDVALRLQQDPRARAVIVGFATSTEASRAIKPEATTKLAEQRAVNAKAYLVEAKGIAADRIEVREDVLGPEKAEVWIVPQGATYAGSGQTFNESAVKPATETGGGHPRR